MWAAGSQHTPTPGSEGEEEDPQGVADVSLDSIGDSKP